MNDRHLVAPWMAQLRELQTTLWVAGRVTHTAERRGGLAVWMPPAIGMPLPNRALARPYAKEPLMGFPQRQVDEGRPSPPHARRRLSYRTKHSPSITCRSTAIHVNPHDLALASCNCIKTAESQYEGLWITGPRRRPTGRDIFVEPSRV
jgi:hypothetical protein